MGCKGNSPNINKTFIIEPGEDNPIVSACTFVYTNEVISCSGDTSIKLTEDSAIFNNDILPEIDNTIDIGKPSVRFRNLNSFSGNTSYWTSTIEVETPLLRLGFDDLNNERNINANNSIIQDDVLNGGTY